MPAKTMFRTQTDSNWIKYDSADASKLEQINKKITATKKMIMS